MRPGRHPVLRLSLTCLLGSVLILAGQSAVAQADDMAVVSLLPDAVRNAVLRHPLVPQAVARINEEAERIDVARSAYHPQLRGGVDIGNGWENERYRRYASISVSQMLYDFGRTSNQVDIARAGTDVQRASLMLQLDELSVDVSRAFTEVLRHQALLALTSENITRINEIGDLARQRRDLGAGNGSDAIQARSREESARADELSLQMMLARWRIILSSLIQVPIADVLIDDLDALDSYQCQSSARTDASSASLLLAEAERNEARTLLQSEKLNRYPSISIESGVRKPVFDNRFDSGASDYNVALKVSMDLYQGGRVSALSRSAEHRLRSSEMSADLARLKMVQQIDESNAQIAMLTRREQILQAQEASARETRELYREQYISLGTRSLLDLLNSEQELHMARYERQAVRYQKAVLKLECMSVTGGLREHFNINIDQLTGEDRN